MPKYYFTDITTSNNFCELTLRVRGGHLSGEGIFSALRPSWAFKIFLVIIMCLKITHKKYFPISQLPPKRQLKSDDESDDAVYWRHEIRIFFGSNRLIIFLVIIYRMRSEIPENEYYSGKCRAGKAN